MLWPLCTTGEKTRYQRERAWPGCILPPPKHTRLHIYTYILMQSHADTHTQEYGWYVPNTQQNEACVLSWPGVPIWAAFFLLSSAFLFWPHSGKPAGLLVWLISTPPHPPSF